MRLIKLQCPKCGATFSVEEGKEIAVCEYCGTSVAVPLKRAKITVKHTKLNRKPFVVLGAAALVLIIVATIIISSVLIGKRVDPSALKSEGIYLVGKDIPAGEYILYPDVSKDDGDVTPVLEVRKTFEAAVDKEDFLYRKEFYGRQYVNLNDGEYIAFEHALLYKPESVKLKPLGKNGYASAQLKVGVDIEAGEYVVVGDIKQVQYYITSKPEAQLFGTLALNSPDMLSFDYCENKVYLKVKDGEYLTFFSGRLYKVGDAPTVSSDEVLPAGQYKVGVDIQSGRYKIQPSENKKASAWVCINKAATKTGSISNWESQNKYVGGETLFFARLQDYGEEFEVEVPQTDGEDIYVTFWDCNATACGRES